MYTKKTWQSYKKSQQVSNFQEPSQILNMPDVFTIIHKDISYIVLHTNEITQFPTNMIFLAQKNIPPSPTKKKYTTLVQQKKILQKMIFLAQ